MNQEHQSSQPPAGNGTPTTVLTRRADPTELASDRPAVDGPAGEKPSELVEITRIIRRSLRGRYFATALLALLCGGLGAGLAWYKVKPTYRSEGLLRIAYQMPEVLQETDQNAPMQMFDAFMFSQRLLITSRRVIDMAIQDPIWKATNRRVPDEPDRYFAEHLDVDIKPRGEFIQISVHDEDPGTAAAAVTAVTNAYTELYSSQDKQMERQRTGVLEDRQTYLQGRLDQLTAQLATSAQSFGTTDLATFYEASVGRVMRLDSTVSEFELALATDAQLKRPSTRPSATRPVAVADAATMTVEQIAAVDPEMRRLVVDESAQRDEVQKLTEMGLGDAHRQVILARQAVARSHDRVTKHAAFFREYRSATGRDLGEPTVAVQAAVDTAKSPEQLKADLDRLRRLADTARTDMIKTGNQQLQLGRLRDELNTTRDQLAQLTRRSATLRTEGSLGGRLSVISSGEIPLSPEKNSRVKFTAGGGLAGMLLATAAMIGVGFLRTRVQYAEESSTRFGTAATMLGILPDLRRADTARAAVAAHAVHQIRVLLQARASDQRSAVYLITSSTSGEGKTSFAMSLALSSAACGLRTLLIDGDLVGRQVTAALGGEARIGLREALDAGTVSGHVMRLCHGLRVLGTGRVRSGDASCVSPSRMRSLLNDARRSYDVVLIDSGPILGSLEAAVLAGEVDAAIMVVTKGQRHEMVRHALVRLRSLGLATIGFVYNRATSRDFDHSPMSATSSSRVMSVPRTEADPAVPPTTGDRRPAEGVLAKFGPLVHAVEADLAAASPAVTASAG